MNTIKAVVTRTVELHLLANVTKAQSVPFDAGDQLAVDDSGCVYLVKPTKTVQLTESTGSLTSAGHGRRRKAYKRYNKQDKSAQLDDILEIISSLSGPASPRDIHKALRRKATPRFSAWSSVSSDVLRHRLREVAEAGLIRRRNFGQYDKVS